MRTRLAAAALALLAALPSSALADWGGTSQGTYAVGGSLLYEPKTVDGGRLTLEGHGGMYLLDAFLLGGSAAYSDDDVFTAWEAAVLAQYHFLDPLVVDEEGRPYAVSPYVGARLGVVSGENYKKDDLGLLGGLRLGLDVFLTQKVALDFMLDLDVSTAHAFPDDYAMKTSRITFRIGLDFHF